MNNTELVQKVENLCDAFENLPHEVHSNLTNYSHCSNTTHVLSVAATIANIRLYYYIKRFHENKHGFEELNFLLTNPQSSWEKLNSEEKVALIKKNTYIITHVLVFVST